MIKQINPPPNHAITHGVKSTSCTAIIKHAIKVIILITIGTMVNLLFRLKKPFFSLLPSASVLYAESTFSFTLLLKLSKELLYLPLQIFSLISELTSSLKLLYEDDGEETLPAFIV